MNMRSHRAGGVTRSLMYTVSVSPEPVLPRKMSVESVTWRVFGFKF